MPKKARDGRPKKERPMTGEATPPRLNEELIAQLQNAVRAAQRKRMPESNDPTANRSAEKDF
jgi:hypothetical protein